MRTSNKTLAFSIISYLLIAALAFLYIQSKADLRVLFSQISPGPQPFSGSGFGIALAVFFGIGACVCLAFALGMAARGQGDGDSFVSRTMQASDRHNATIGEIVFSDYTRKPGTILDALRLQAQTLVRGLFKILTVYLSVATLNRAMMIVVVILVFVPDIVLDHTMPMLWNAVIYLFWFLVCYRAQLSIMARTKGVARTSDERGNHRVGVSSLHSPIQLASTNGVTPEFIEEVLCQESVIAAIKDDLINAGANYVDAEVVRDGSLITSRKPDDLPAFCREIVEALAK